MKLSCFSSIALFCVGLPAYEASVRGDSVILFNEIMYHPANDAQELEFVELFNTLCFDMDLSGWKLTGGIEYTFPLNTTIPSEGFLVIAKSPSALEAMAGIAKALGPFSGHLDNGGESIRLENNSGRVMDELNYGDAGQWPVAPDGSGATLAKVAPFTASATASGWQAGQVGGTPGRNNFGNGGTGTVVETPLISKTANWKYRDLGTDPGGNWMLPGYDDSGWASGPAVLGYGDAWVITTVSYGPDSANKYPTTYFRYHFNVADPADFSSLQFMAMMDDGAILYLNGTEFARVRLDAGNITYLDYANTAVSGAAEGIYETLTLPVGLLQAGDNVLAAEVHQQSGGSTDMDFAAELIGLTTLPPPETEASLLNPSELVINEVAGVTNTSWWIELKNNSDVALDPTGYVMSVAGDPARQYTLSGSSIPAGGFLLLTAAQLGFTAINEEPIFLYRPGMESVADARVAKRSLRGRLEADWLIPSAPTPGTTNSFVLNTNIVINEIMYHHQATNEGGSYVESEAEWIELYNRGPATVDLSGWKFDDGLSYEFPVGTTMGPGAYLVVSNFSGSLSDGGERILLVDAAGNPADEVHYFDGGRWPEYADGGGSSLELRDPFADNSKPEAWAASAEGMHSTWQDYTNQVVASASSVGPDSQWREFVLGLLSAGEVLLDDISVIEDPGGANTELVSTRDFEGGVGDWRIIGNHRHSAVIVDPDNAANHVLRLVAAGATEHMHNHAEITLAGGESVENGKTYRITFRAKWMGGSRLLNTRLYFNRAAATHVLSAPMNNGTPGAQNSTYAGNIGPTFAQMLHDPAVPDAGEPVNISVLAADPQGVTSVRVRCSVNGGAWQQTPMTNSGAGRYSTTLAGQAASSIVQFYVEAEDGPGAVSAFPAAGPDSRALYMVNDGQSDPLLHNFRIIMTTADSVFMHADVESMSNEQMPCTVIFRDQDIYYNAGVHLKGALGGRNSDVKTGYRLGFNMDQLFNGVLDTVAVDKSSLTDVSRMPELLTFLAVNRAGAVATKYSDWIKVIAPRTQRSGPAQLQLGHYSDLSLDGQFDQGSDGGLFEFEYVYYQVATNSAGYKISTGRTHTEKAMESYSGNNKEDYRHTFLIKNHRAQDDYSALIDFVAVMGSSGEDFSSRIDSVIDVDQWLRAFAYAVANGCRDNFSIGSYHNAYFYRRPADGRFLYIPHDMDQSHTTPSLVSGSPYLQKMIGAKPEWERLYYSHMRDIIETAWNPTYMQIWTTRFSALMPGASGNFAGFLTHIGNCYSSLSSQLASRVAPAYPFAVTSGNQTNSALSAAVTGNAWLDVYEVYLAGQNQPLSLTWTATGSGTNRVYSWSANVPIEPGINPLVFLAYDYRGNLVGSNTVTLTSTAVSNPLREHLRITELMVDPAGGSDYEFVELHNAGGQALDLSGVHFSQGITFDFSAAGFTNLNPGEFCVLAADLAAFTSWYGSTGITVAGQYSGKLANEGETIEILGGLNEEILRFTYGSGRGWPLAAEGCGHALVPLDSAIAGEADGSLDYGGNWRAGNWIGGSPGQAEIPLPLSLQLNEIVAHSDYSDPAHPEYDSNDQIELYNASVTTLVLGTNWYLSDDAGQLDKWMIPAGTTIPPHGHVAFDEVTGFHSPITNGFGLDKDGERVLLAYLPPAGSQRVVDAVRFKGQENGVALGRYGDGSAYWCALTPTIGATNAKPALHAVISEIMYHPPDNPTNNTLDEFVEIHNPTDTAIELGNASGPWRIDGGVSFAFPSNTTLAAGESVVLVTFDPSDVGLLASFLATYGLTSGEVAVLGPLSGQLDNRGERLALERPQPGDLAGDPVSWVIVDEAIYFSQSPWPAAADGAGCSLQRRFTRWSGNDPNSWYASFTSSPGRIAENYGTQAVPDWWLSAQDSTWTNGFATVASADPDGDGLSTGREYVAGTHPLLPESSLRLELVPGGIGFATVKTGPEYNGLERWYSLQVAADLGSGSFSPVPGFAGIPGDGEIHIYPVPLVGGNTAFYRLEVSLR